MPFLLTTEPWIPCRALDGSHRELGLLDVLVGAHDLEGVHDASPPVTLTVHRLLLAVLHRVFGPSDLGAWRMLYTRGSFDASALRGYFEAHRDRFDLLHPVRPFYQVRGLTKLYQPDGVGRLVLERSNYGASVNIFQHRAQPAATADGLPLAAAARSLLALQGFAPGGLVKKKDEPGSATAAPLNRGAFVLLHGKSLFETLMLNLLVYAPDRGAPIPGFAAEDLPSWETPEPARQTGARESRRRPRGWIDWLTWQSRRVELVVDDRSGLVTGVVYCVGQGLHDEGLTDPMLAYRVDKTRGLVAIDLSEDRAAWRDCHALVRKVEADGAKPPQTVTQLGRFELRSVLGARPYVVLDVIGMRGDQAAIKLARHERVSLPSAVLVDDERLAAVGQATHAVDDIGRQLTYAVRDAVRRTLAPGDRDPDKEEVSRIAYSLGAERRYWATLATPFATFLDELGRDDIEVAFERFARHIRAAARDCLRLATDALGVGAAKLQGAAIAERHLHASLNEILPVRAATHGSPGGPP